MVPLALATALRDIGFCLCILGILAATAFGRRPWPKTPPFPTIWNPVIRERATEALRESRPRSESDDDEKGKVGN
jgi:hypothetical protein